jgi:hypothetical protein
MYFIMDKELNNTSDNIGMKLRKKNDELNKKIDDLNRHLVKLNCFYDIEKCDKCKCRSVLREFSQIINNRINNDCYEISRKIKRKKVYRYMYYHLANNDVDAYDDCYDDYEDCVSGLTCKYLYGN